MREFVLIINEEKIAIAKALLEENKINYREAGYPDGKVVVTESYPSKINIHTDLKNFAISKGYKSIVDAIGKIGAKKLKKPHNEYTETLNV